MRTDNIRSAYLHYYEKGKQELQNVKHTSCYSGIKEILPLVDKLYISNFRKASTEQHIERLLGIINKITPCALVTIKEQEYIEFTTLKTYDQNLILLNFIRNLWWAQAGFDADKFFAHIHKTTFIDPLSKLFASLKKGCETVVIKDHSNCVPAKEIVIRKKKELLEWSGINTGEFIKGK